MPWTPAEALASKHFRAIAGAGPHARVVPYLDRALAGKPELRPSTVNVTAIVRSKQHGEQVRVYAADWRRAVFQATAWLRLRPKT